MEVCPAPATATANYERAARLDLLFSSLPPAAQALCRLVLGGVGVGVCWFWARLIRKQLNVHSSLDLGFIREFLTRPVFLTGRSSASTCDSIEFAISSRMLNRDAEAQAWIMVVDNYTFVLRNWFSSIPPRHA